LRTHKERSGLDIRHSPQDKDEKEANEIRIESAFILSSDIKIFFDFNPSAIMRSFAGYKTGAVTQHIIDTGTCCFYILLVFLKKRISDFLVIGH
jgi:hypothetical protein